MRAPGGESRQRHPGDRDGRADTAPPPGCARAHTAKLITPVRSALPRFQRDPAVLPDAALEPSTPTPGATRCRS